MIQAGTVLDFNVRGTTEAAQFQIIFNEAMLAGAAADKLSQNVEVIDIDVKADGTVITGTLPWNYTARVRVRTRSAHSQPADVAAIVAHAFFTAAGNMPAVTIAGAPMPGTSAQPLPRSPELDLNFSWSTALVVVGVAVLVLAWKF